MSKDISKLNFVSFAVYHIAILLGFMLFMLMLIPVRILLCWCTSPVFWRELNENIDEFASKLEARWRKDWVRLGGKL